MNNERYNQIIDEAYENYLKNFIEPTCPPNLDVQPSYYDPMTKDWFVKSAKERGSRGDGFSEKWGLKIEEKELSLEERYEIRCKKENIRNDFWQFYHTFGGYKNEMDSLKKSLNDNNIPTKLITITYKNEKTEVYE